MTTSTMSPKVQKTLFRVAIPLAVWLGIWQLASWWVGRDLLLPSPASVAVCLVELGQTGEFWLSAVSTLTRVACGLVGGVVLGTLLAFLTHFSTWADRIFSPAIRVLRATPVCALFCWSTYGWPGPTFPDSSRE